MLFLFGFVWALVLLLAIIAWLSGETSTKQTGAKFVITVLTWIIPILLWPLTLPLLILYGIYRLVQDARGL